MAHISLQNTKNGRTYINYVEAYWDKEIKSPRNKKVLIGRLDRVTGELYFNDNFKDLRKRSPEVIKLLKEKFGLNDSYVFQS
jgi:hypothetical protein